MTSMPGVAHVQIASSVSRGPHRNLVPAILDAVTAHVTVGEVTAALEDVFGTWVERAVA